MSMLQISMDPDMECQPLCWMMECLSIGQLPCQNLYPSHQKVCYIDPLTFLAVMCYHCMLGLKSRNSLESTSPSSIQYALQSTSSGVCITCTFLESSTTDCVAVVHQRISQLNSNGLMNIESSHKFTRSGDTASGCIEGVNLEDYQVGIIAITQTISPTTNSLGSQLSIIGWNLSLVFPFLLLIQILCQLLLEVVSPQVRLLSLFSPCY